MITTVKRGRGNDISQLFSARLSFNPFMEIISVRYDSPIELFNLNTCSMMYIISIKKMILQYLSIKWNSE